MEALPRTDGYRALGSLDHRLVDHTPAHADAAISPPLTPYLGASNDGSSVEANESQHTCDHDHDESQHHEQDHYDAQQPLRDNCDRRRTGTKEGGEDSRLKMPSSELVGKAVQPFLKDHIPKIYAPIGKEGTDMALTMPAIARNKDTNSKFCYRHRPDGKCRRVADENKMGSLQSNLSSLSTADQSAITTVWSLFSAAPARHRAIMLQGIVTQCCFPQLSTISREVQEQLKIDFLDALPTELSFKILESLDTVSLCKAAQVSHRWKELADDNVVWHRMCEQHIDRKCTKCGWGLPLLERKKLAAWSRSHRQPAPRKVTEIIDPITEAPVPVGSTKRSLQDDQDPDAQSKRPKLASTASQREVERRFKDLYRQRFKVGRNWKSGRCSIKTFKGHDNGVLCLQFEHNIMATGSYDATIKIWDIESGECIRTLRGHTGPVRALQFDESKLISGSFDKTIKVWNWRTGECLRTMQCHTEGVMSVHFDGCILASGSIDKEVKIFNFQSKELCTLRGHKDWVNHVRIDSASRTIFSASDDLTVKLWDLDTKTCIKTFTGHVGQVQQVLLMPPDFEPDEVESEHNDTSSNRSNRSLSPDAPIPPTAYGANFGGDTHRPLPPRYMLTGGLDNTVRLWDTATGQCIRSMFGHVEGVWGLVGDTLRVVTCANDSMTKIWEPRSGKCERSFTGHKGPVTCVGLSDSRMATGSEDGEVRLYSFEGEVYEERGTPS